MAGAPAGGHSELMDRIYRHQRHIYDLTRKYYLFGRDKAIRELDLKPGERLVEVGCGTARNLIAIARRYPGVHLYGLDASHAMLATAQENVRRVQSRIGAPIELKQGYAEEMNSETFGAGAFDRVLFSYSLSMIPDWRGALAAAASVVKTEGELEIVDFGDLAGLGSVAGGALRGWLKLFHVRPRKEILQGVESASREGGASLWISPGRYAFIWRGGADDLQRLMISAVAAR
jgi:S-adenosylmethionine-diacylgycerolhomoserine-N-methlytransferase